MLVSDQKKSQKWYLCQINFNLFVCLATTPKQLVLKGSKFHCMMGVTLQMLKQSLGEIVLFTNSSQPIGPKGLQFSGFDGGYPGDI